MLYDVVLDITANSLDILKFFYRKKATYDTNTMRFVTHWPRSVDRGYLTMVTKGS